MHFKSEKCYIEFVTSLRISIRKMTKEVAWLSFKNENNSNLKLKGLFSKIFSSLTQLAGY